MEHYIPETVPEMHFKILLPPDQSQDGVCPAVDAHWGEVTTEQMFKGKKVILFALPGAYTPTCSSSHLPGYEEHYEEFKKLGIDEIYCLSVNDPFVMYEWGRAQGIKHVQLIPDGVGSFTQMMGMLVKKDNLGFGNRSWRYSMLVEDGKIKKMFSEDGKSDNCETDPFVVSDAGTMLAYLRAQA